MTADAQAAAEALFGGQAVAGAQRAVGGTRVTAAQALAVITQPVELFHSSDGRAWATMELRGHSETWPVRSKRFKAFLGRAYYGFTKRQAQARWRAEALALAEARGLDGPELAVHVRVAESDGRVYIDLADEWWHVVEVDALGWRVLERAPVKFHRAAGMLALPKP